MHRKHLILAVLVTALWGLNFPITKLGLAHVDPLLLTGLRFALFDFPWVIFIKRPKDAVRW
jgi:O-acetylserine/cysteine efflux transporter